MFFSISNFSSCTCFFAKMILISNRAAFHKDCFNFAFGTKNDRCLKSPCENALGNLIKFFNQEILDIAFDFFFLDGYELGLEQVAFQA